ncbi:hypothetical protein AG1IA_09964 [Rhizoctonia solani AG-1 IA]|uniref:Uncharacterized protein n=1 Tax=Thanatephorus cucumeris (strain AG1-IA) TaxID=983506 RepID=L8WCV0_THACA|nr:hypothetical protein AG1IA_09964 [Rhizoctonia solani AG-1 IA]
MSLAAVHRQCLPPICQPRHAWLQHPTMTSRGQDTGPCRPIKKPAGYSKYMVSNPLPLYWSCERTCLRYPDQTLALCSVRPGVKAGREGSEMIVYN